jgi:hypothetical protein
MGCIDSIGKASPLYKCGIKIVTTKPARHPHDGTDLGARRSIVDSMWRQKMSGDMNEWSLLKDQFDVLVHDESVGSDSIENIFNDQFHRRFAELINRVTERNSKTGYTDWSRR